MISFDHKNADIEIILLSIANSNQIILKNINFSLVLESKCSIIEMLMHTTKIFNNQCNRLKV